MPDKDYEQTSLLFRSSPSSDRQAWKDLAESARDAAPVTESPGPTGSLKDLAAVAAGCRKCGLRDGCSQVVFGAGDPNADLMLVGEAPGRDEDRQGLPFVGRAGQLLDRILGAAGLERDRVYITNVVKCRPPSNRTPTLPEMAACLPLLQAQTRLIRPKLIVAMGSTALKAMVNPQARITRMRGTWQVWEGIPLLPTFHPAALLRDPGKKRPVWDDFKLLLARREELRGQGA